MVVTTILQKASVPWKPTKYKKNSITNENTLSQNLTDACIAAGADAMVYVWLVLIYCTVYLAQESNLYCCICYHCDRPGFCAEIQNIFGTVQNPCYDANKECNYEEDWEHALYDSNDVSRLWLCLHLFS